MATACAMPTRACALPSRGSCRTSADRASSPEVPESEVHDDDDVREIFTHAVTGADGRFRIEGLWNGTADLSLRGEVSVPLWVDDRRVEAGRVDDVGDIAVGLAPPLRGLVVDPQGRPVAGARVVLCEGATSVSRDSPEASLIRPATTASRASSPSRRAATSRRCTRSGGPGRSSQA
jgi:hypothetical protein